MPAWVRRASILLLVVPASVAVGQLVAIVVDGEPGTTWPANGRRCVRPRRAAVRTHRDRGRGVEAGRVLGLSGGGWLTLAIGLAVFAATLVVMVPCDPYLTGLLGAGS
ncbi:MAG: hypothetical protein R2705_12990 [Ilumatobacteraceae bacterium]